MELLTQVSAPKESLFVGLWDRRGMSWICHHHLANSFPLDELDPVVAGLEDLFAGQVFAETAIALGCVEGIESLPTEAIYFGAERIFLVHRVDDAARFAVVGVIPASGNLGVSIVWLRRLSRFLANADALVLASGSSHQPWTASSRGRDS